MVKWTDINGIPHIDHTEYPKSLETFTVAKLHNIIEDCKSALSVPTNPKNSYYMDEIAYCSTELLKRSKCATCGR